MRILTNSEMRAADARTIAGGVSGRELMRRAAEALFKNLPKGKKTYIVCGKGNNGGDGWALALRMLNCGEAATVFYTDEQKGEGEFFAAQFLSAGGRALPIEKCDYECEVLVECLFGTGFHGKVSGVYAEAIERINASGAYVVSADIPSGLNGDNGRGEVAVKADVTVAIQAAKLGHFLGKGKDVCGKLVVEDIGIDCGDLGALLVDGEFCKRLFPPRRHDSNKGSYGRCALIGGSIKYPGAIKLANAGLCALQSGCGLCTIAVPAFLAPALSACVVTWFNPQALIDGTMMLGAFHVTLSMSQATPFMAGVVSASFLWFFGLTFFISLYSHKFNAKALRIVNVVCGAVIAFYGAKLFWNFLQLMGWV